MRIRATRSGSCSSGGISSTPPAKMSTIAFARSPGVGDDNLPTDPAGEHPGKSARDHGRPACRQAIERVKELYDRIRTTS